LKYRPRDRFLVELPAGRCWERPEDMPPLRPFIYFLLHHSKQFTRLHTYSLANEEYFVFLGWSRTESLGTWATSEPTIPVPDDR
jgi:hypothetical protein